jgi:hypothetical protein
MGISRATWLAQAVPSPCCSWTKLGREAPEEVDISNKRTAVTHRSREEEALNLNLLAAPAGTVTATTPALA